MSLDETNDADRTVALDNSVIYLNKEEQTPVVDLRAGGGQKKRN